MSSPDRRHYERLFNHNPYMQENFLITLLSMRDFYRHSPIASSSATKERAERVAAALELVIEEFSTVHPEWISEGSVAYGGVKEVLEKRHEI